MRRILFDPNALGEPLKSEWSTWIAKAMAATNHAINLWEEWRDNGSVGKFEVALDEKIWGDLKDFLIKNVFNNKCAYCETREVRSPYHAEHFRPKGRVSFQPEGKRKFQKVLITDELGNQMEHPGYFWLAYNWANLLPSCNYCNTALGKKDQFPVKKGYVSVTKLTADQATKLARKEIESLKRPAIYYLQPDDLNTLEEPLLINPYLDDPAEHIVFGDRGFVAAREGSEKGLASIKVYNLDAEELRIARQVAQEEALHSYGVELTRGKKKTIPQRKSAAKASIKDYIRGKEPYSAAVIDYLRIVYPDHKL